MIMANKIINWIANEFKNNVKQWVGDAVASSPALSAWVETAWISSLAGVPNLASDRADRRRWVKKQAAPTVAIKKAADPVEYKWFSL